MASPSTPSNYRPIPGRNITKRWKEANTVDYGGDDWGSEDYGDPQTAVHDQRGQGWGPGSSQQSYDNPAGQYHPSDRTNTMRSTGGQSFHSNTGRPSFDQGDERRNLSNVGTFQDGPYPTAARQAFPELQHDIDPRDYEPEPPMRGLRGPPPLQVQTNARPASRERGPFSAPYHGPDPRMNQYPDSRAGPFSAAAAHSTGRRSQSSGRPSQAEIYGRYDGPPRPGSRGSQGTSPARQQLPPRKSSLGQQNPLPGTYTAPLAAPPNPETTSTTASKPGSDAKALPFLRPIDIWKRHEEEQNERRSQESSRPSFDSSASKDRAGSTLGNSKDVQSSETPAHAPVTHSDAEPVEEAQPSRSVLDPVEERKSEYGLDGMLKEANPTIPSNTAPLITQVTAEPEPASASSDYLNRPDDASLYSTPSFRDPGSHPQRQMSDHSAAATGPFLPAVRTISGFGNDFLVGDSHSKGTSSVDTAPPVPTKDPPPVPGTEALAVPTTEPSTNSPPATTSQPALQHNTSHGYRSLVEQAFDESQREPPTPVSAADTFPRSNSASTFDISPIVSRNAGQPFPITHQSISEEAPERSNLSVTQAAEANSAEAMPSPAFKRGYRRDTATPSPDNSPARMPVTAATFDVPEAELGTTSSTNPDNKAESRSEAHKGVSPSISVNQAHPQEEERVSRFDKPLPLANQTSPDARSASSEYRDWQAQRKQFNAKMGITTDSPSTPGVPSPISRADSPTKGTVREIAGMLENNSGRSSPVNAEMSRPSQNRLESFRPSLPGGWQSYSTNTPQQESRSISPEPVSLARPEMPYRTETTESQIPRAGPWQPKSQNDSISTSAFAAAAAAGTALAGAFGGSGGSEGSKPSGMSRMKNMLGMSHEESDDETNTTEPVSRDEPDKSETSATRDFARAQPIEPAPLPPTGSVLAPPGSPLPPPPLPKDTPRELEPPQSAAEYFPAPLKTKKSNETRIPGRTSLQPDLDQDMSPNEENNNRLRQEIEQSLTPRSSRLTEESVDPVREVPELEQTGPMDALPGAFPEESTQAQDYGSYRRDGRNEDTDEISRENSIREEPARPSGSTPGPGFLAQRFSWEKGQSPSDTNKPLPPAGVESSATPRANQISEFSAGSPETIRAPGRTVSPVDANNSTSNIFSGSSAAAALAAAPAAAPLATSALGGRSNISPSTPVERSIEDAQQTPIGDVSDLRGPSALTPTGSAPSSTIHGANASSGRQLGTREIPFREILSMNNPDDKLRAYSANRQHFGASDGGLERWLHSMGQQSPDNANILASNGKLSRDQIDAIQTYRPSPAKASISRLTSGTFSSPGTSSGASDGKRLVSAAGKFSKGLLAKGKDKFRTAGAGDKGNRRRPSEPMPVAVPEESPQHSTTTFSAPPQIPEQNLNISPVNQDSWALPFESTNATPTDRSNTSFPAIDSQRNYASASEPPSHASHLAAVSLPGAASTLAPSPKVSVISRDNGDVPSRSISEATRSGEERSPVGRVSQEHAGHTRDTVAAGAMGLAMAGTVAAAVAERRGGSTPSSDFPTPKAAVRNDLNTPAVHVADQHPSFHDREIDHNHFPKPPDTAQSGNLTAPRSKRYSEVSNISNPGLGAGIPDEAMRSISPALTSNPPANQNDPGSYAGPTSASQRIPEESPSQIQEELSSPQRGPLESEPPISSRTGPHGEIRPEADLSTRRREEDQSMQPRPFSFAASNVLMEPVQQNAGLLEREVYAKSPTPASAPLNKEWSNVSVDEVPDDLRNQDNRTSKSYSRPFGAEPNVGDHPAFRSSPTHMDRSQLYSSESPLPSARRNSPLPSANRPPEDFSRPRQEGAPRPQPDEQYRIPGPYVQEYRSPKQPPQGLAQRQWPTNQQEQQGQIGSPQNHQPQSSGMSSAQNPQQQYNQMTLPLGQNQRPLYNQMGSSQSQEQYQQQFSPVQQRGMPPPEKPKHRTIGGLFRSRSKSGSRNGRQDSYGDNPDARPEKRNSLFKTKSRQDSISSSQHSQSLRESESRDQVPALPHWSASEAVNGSNKRNSKEMFRSSTSSHTDLEMGKKKRHSGLGGLFSRASKSGPPKRSSTTDSKSGKPSKLGALQQEFYNQQVSPSKQNNAPPGRQSPENFRGNPPPPRGYYGPSDRYDERGREQPHPASAFPHGPDSVGGQYPQSQQAPYAQSDARSQSYHDNMTPSYQQQQQQPDQRQFDQRPSNLRVDTGSRPMESSSNHSQYPNTGPATAPPVPAPNSYHHQSAGNPAIYSYDRPQAQSQSSHPSSEPSRGLPPSSHQFYDQTQEQSQGQSQSKPQPSQPSYTTTTAPLAAASTAATAAGTSHALDLHKRSRSPRNGRRPSDDDLLDVQKQNGQDPASQLGTFKNRSPAGGVSRDDTEGVQEKPWRIDIPQGETEAEAREREAKRKNRQMLIERGGTAGVGSTPNSAVQSPQSATRSPIGSGAGVRQSQESGRPLTVAEKIMGAQPERAALSPSGTNANRDVKGGTGAGMSGAVSKDFVAELPGSKAEGYESEEEIPMSATAYPGQEWMPFGAQEMGYGKWDD